MGAEESDRMSIFTRESVAAIFAITCEADLAHRQRVLKERENIPDDRLIPFFAVMPDGYSADEQKKWIKVITHSLDAVVADAHRDIMVDRTIETMKDLGLGDDGEGNFRE